jgi:Xaa-Pro aminopeptidase
MADADNEIAPWALGASPPPLPAELFAERRRALATRMGPGAVMVLPGARVQHSSRDSEYPFRPDSELYWCTGLDLPEALAVISTVEGGAGGDAAGVPQARLTLFVQPLDAEAERWAGVREAPEAIGARLGADAVFALDELPTQLAPQLDAADTVFFRFGAHEHIEGHIVEALQRARARGARKGSGPRRVIDPGEALDALRLVKDAHEIARIRAAAALTLEGFRALSGRVHAGVGEWALQAELEAAFRRGGGDGPAFGTIVASGANACVLHYVSNRDRLTAGQMVLVDAGASRGWYAGDVTRSFPVDGRFSPEARAVYDAVERARAAAVAAVRPGVTIEAVHRAALEVLCAFLVDEGRVAGSVSDVLESESYKPFYPHSTSHWLGLDVHDVGDYALKGEGRVLEPGMVLTVEPGLYFTTDPRFSQIGVRIEDDVLVTADGHENLTQGVATDAEAMAALAAG